MLRFQKGNNIPSPKKIVGYDRGFPFDLSTNQGRLMWKSYQEKNPEKAKELKYKYGIYEGATLPEVEIKSSFIPTAQTTNDGGFGYGKPVRRYTGYSNKQEATNARGLSKTITGGIDFIPGIGDIKGLYDVWNEYKSKGTVSPISIAAILPVLGIAGDAAKVFKPVIKEYRNSTEMFLDIIKQAEEQGIKVNRESNLYKQILEEVPGARKYYKDFNNSVATNNIEEDLIKEFSNFKDDIVVKIKKQPDGEFSIILKDKNGSRVGEYFVGQGASQIKMANLKPEYQRKGITNEVYNRLNNIISNYSSSKGLQSDNLRSEAAESFWKKRNAIYDEKSNTYFQKINPKLSDQQIADGLWLSTKTEQARKGLKEATDNLEYHGTGVERLDGDEFNIDITAPEPAIFTTPFKKVAKDYSRFAFPKNRKFSPTIFPLLTKNNNRRNVQEYYESLLPNNKDVIPPYNSTAMSKSIKDSIKKGYDNMKVVVNDLNYAEPQIATFYPNYVKSLFREHLAKWNWDDPNIHKAVVGATLGLGLHKQAQENKKKKPLSFKKGGWIKNAIKKPGALTASAKRAGMSISEYCAQSNLSTKSKQRCNLAKTLKGFKK
jgi:hypothetical protein